KGIIKHIGGNGHCSKVIQTVSRSIGQLVHHNSAITTRQLAVRIQDTHNISISHTNIWRHMAKKGYNSAIPLSTPMLTI
ncbi:12255_t:CDS:1, partial [Entrophospora sp. SA101]